MIRARDIWTAAFDDDVQRLRRLVTKNVPRDNDEDEEDTGLDDNFAAALEADEDWTRMQKLYRLTNQGDDDDRSSDGDFIDDLDATHTTPQTNVDSYNDHLQEDLGRAHLSSATATARREEEEDAQERDLARYRVIIRKRLRHRLMASMINTPGMMLTGPNKREVDLYGVLFRVTEVLDEEAENEDEADADEEEEHDGDESVSNRRSPRREGDVDAHTRRGLQAPHRLNDTQSYTLTSRLLSEGMEPAGAHVSLPQSPYCHSILVQWKPSRRSHFPAFPLHWAVLGRAHRAVAFLIAHGAHAHHGMDDALCMYAAALRDGCGSAGTNSGVRKSSTGLPLSGDEASRTSIRNAAHDEGAERAHMKAAALHALYSGNNNKDEVNKKSSNSSRAAMLECIFPPGLTAAKMAEDNRSHETLRVLQCALAAHQASVQRDTDEMQQLESRMEHRKACREKRRLRREQRRAALEEAAEMAHSNEENDNVQDEDEYEQ